MAKIVMEEAVEILTFPKDTLLDLKVEEAKVVHVDSQRDNDPGWDSLELKLKVLDIVALGDGSTNKEPYSNWIGQFVYAKCSWKFTTSPQNKLRRYAEAIFRQSPLAEGFELDSDLFVGRRVRGITVQYEKSTRDPSGKPYIGHKVDELLEYKGDAMPSAPSVQQAPDPWAAPTVNANTTQQPVTAGQTSQDPWATGWGTDDAPPF